MTPEQEHSKKIAKIDVYLGYGVNGSARRHKITDYSKRHKTAVAKLVLAALKEKYPEMGL